MKLVLHSCRNPKKTKRRKRQFGPEKKSTEMPGPPTVEHKREQFGRSTDEKLSGNASWTHRFVTTTKCRRALEKAIPSVKCECLGKRRREKEQQQQQQQELCEQQSERNSRQRNKRSLGRHDATRGLPRRPTAGEEALVSAAAAVSTGGGGRGGGPSRPIGAARQLSAHTKMLRQLNVSRYHAEKVNSRSLRISLFLTCL